MSITPSQRDAARLLEIKNLIDWHQDVLARVTGFPIKQADGAPAPVCWFIGYHNAAINRLKTERAAIIYRRTHPQSASDRPTRCVEPLVPDQLKAALAGHDLTTFDGWMAACRALLAGWPDWTGLRDKSGTGYLVTVGGEVFAAPMCEHARDPHLVGDLITLDRGLWSESHRCWEGSTPEACAATLQEPEFLALALCQAMV